MLAPSSVMRDLGPPSHCYFLLWTSLVWMPEAVDGWGRLRLPPECRTLADDASCPLREVAWRPLYAFIEYREDEVAWPYHATLTR